MIPVLVCTFAIFLLSAMDAAMKSLVIAVGVYNVVLWRSLLAALVSAAGWAAAGCDGWPWAKAGADNPMAAVASRLRTVRRMGESLL